MNIFLLEIQKGNNKLSYKTLDKLTFVYYNRLVVYGESHNIQLKREYKLFVTICCGPICVLLITTNYVA